ncbi:MAG: glycerol-3-phosphate 1-O-acyltransferase PlsY [bacterium]
MVWRFLWVIGCYVAGSIPSGYWIVKLARGIDIRDHGSGNIGFTNVLRVCGPKLGIPSFLLDILKGAVPVFAVVRLFPDNTLLHVVCAAACLAGHSWSCFLGFRGGKIVATSLGVFLVLKWEAILISGAVFLLVFLVTRIVSVGSLSAALALVVIEVIEYALFPSWAPTWEVFGFSVLAAALIFIKHRSNIRRLLAGEEKRLALRKGDSA